MALQFSHRNSDANGVVERLRLAHFDRLVAQVFEHVPWSDDYGRELRTLIERANTSVLDALQDALDLVAGLPQARESVPLAWPRLAAIAASERASEAAVLSQLDQVLERYSPCLCRAFRAADGSTDDAGVAA